MARKTFLTPLLGVIRRPALWLIVIYMVIITVVHYVELGRSYPLYDWFTQLGLTRHALDRILYLAPIAFAGFTFGWVGGITVSLLALAAMLPRALLITATPLDAILETGAVFILGNVLAMTFHALRKEREYHRQVESAQEKMRFYLAEVNKAQEEERKRISHELHDDSIQALVVLSRQLDALASTPGTDLLPEYRQRLEKMRQDTTNIMTGIRRLSQDLRPAALERLGLTSALASLAEEITRYSGIPIEMRVNDEVGRLPEDKELVIFRIVQEALRNVWRHSKATAASVVIEVKGKNLNIIINDNGKGFEMPEHVSDLPVKGKLGMAGMQERAQLIGATLSIQSKPAQGTKISLWIDIS